MADQAAAQAATAQGAGTDPAAQQAAQPLEGAAQAQQAQAGDTGTAGEGENQPAGGSRTFSQEEVNNLLAAERKAERAKYAAFKQKADGYDALLAERDELKAAGERRSLVAKVSEEEGVPAELVEMLSGATEQELAEQARRLAKAVQAPVSTEGGKPAGVKPSGTAEFVSNLFGN